MACFEPCFILNKTARIINENDPGWYRYKYTKYC